MSAFFPSRETGSRSDVPQDILRPTVAHRQNVTIMVVECSQAAISEQSAYGYGLRPRPIASEYPHRQLPRPRPRTATKSVGRQHLEDLRSWNAPREQLFIRIHSCAFPLMPLTIDIQDA